MSVLTSPPGILRDIDTDTFLVEQHCPLCSPRDTMWCNIQASHDLSVMTPPDYLPSLTIVQVHSVKQHFPYVLHLIQCDAASRRPMTCQSWHPQITAITYNISSTYCEATFPLCSPLDTVWCGIQTSHDLIRHDTPRLPPSLTIFQ